MGKTIGGDVLRASFSGGQRAFTAGYHRRDDGVLVYRGERPGPGWHRHGFFSRWLWVVCNGMLSRERVLKQRWLLPGEGRTRSSHPPDELGQVWASAVAVLLVLWSWLDDDNGADRREDIAPSADGYPSSRTARRWLRRALPLAMLTQQAIRRAVIERVEPRPFERLFPGGLSPPAGLRRRRWQDPTSVSQLWTGLTIALKGALELKIAPPLLLAEARGRLPNPDEPFLI